MTLTAFALFGIAIALGVHAVGSNSRAYRLIYHTNQQIEIIAKMEALIGENRRLAERLYALLSNRDAGAGGPALATRISANRQEVSKLWQDFAGVEDADGDDMSGPIAVFEQRRALWLGYLDVAAIAAGIGELDPAALEAFRGEGARAYDAAQDALRDLRSRQAGLARQQFEQAEAQKGFLSAGLIALGVAGALLLFSATLGALRRVQHGLDHAGQVARAITHGDLEVELPTAGGDEVDSLMAHLGAMRFSLQDLISSLKNSEARSRAVLRTMRDGVVQIDQVGRILAVNDVILELFEYEEGDLLGANVNILMPEPHRSRHDGYLARYFSSREARILHRRVELEAVTKTGRRFPIDLVVNEMVDDEGSVFVGVIRDISDQKLAKRELEKALLAAQSATATKSAFLANMSHELRTPIGAVIGFAQLAYRQAMSDSVRGYVQKIDVAAQGLLSLINDILDLSKIEAGKLQLESVPFALDDVLRHVSTLLAFKAQDKGIDLVVGALPGIPARLVGDPLRLGQVLVNLVSNAVKFTEQGRVTLICERIPGTAADQSVTIGFTVTDTGIGITPEAQEALFTAFTQVDSSTTRKFGGTGLGLAICRQLVEQMGGEIGASSEVGKGSEFWATVPFAVEASGADTPDTARSLAGSRVLVVDDSEMSCVLLQRLLTDLGCEVDVESSGESALRRIEAGAEFDVVTLDWHMPGLDGCETARRLRQQGFDRPIVLITGREGDALPQDSSDFQAVLPKPVAIGVLRDALAALLSGQPQLMQVRPGDEPPPVPDLAGARVLLVDDNDFNRQIGRELLELAHASVTTVEDGAKAVRAVEPGAFDLVLMDLQMPVMDGYTASRRIREAGLELPILALTAHAMKEERARVLEAGMNDLLTKPIEQGAFYRTIVRWLPRHAARASAPDESAPIPTAPVPAAPAAAPADAAGASFDLDAALRRVGGNRAMLQRFLDLFWERNQAVMAQLGAQLEQGDADGARRSAHALKGGAGTVGLVELQGLAERIEHLVSVPEAAAVDRLAARDAFEAFGASWLRSKEVSGKRMADSDAAAQPD